MISEVQPCRTSIKNRVIENSLKITMKTYPKEKKTLNLPSPSFVGLLSCVKS